MLPCYHDQMVLDGLAVNLLNI